MTSTSLEFEMTDDKGRKFLIQFESESTERNLLMQVIYQGLPIDTVDLRAYDISLWRNIKKLMATTAQNHWQEQKQVA